MLFMCIEDFSGRDRKALYRRFRDKGRMAPPGLTFIESWVSADMRKCFVLMEAADVTLLQRWMADWCDLAEFEILPVVTGKEPMKVCSPAACSAVRVPYRFENWKLRRALARPYFLRSTARLSRVRKPPFLSTGRRSGSKRSAPSRYHGAPHPPAPTGRRRDRADDIELLHPAWPP